MAKLNFPHSIRFTDDTRRFLGDLKSEFPQMSCASMVNYILIRYGVPQYQREMRLGSKVRARQMGRMKK